MVEVSVIIPVYNSEPWLEECLQNICNQTLKDIEIICVNDGSTDSSLQILQKYAERDARIIIIDRDHRGTACARNAGMQRAGGKYVYFCDSDDYITCDALHILVEEMQTKKLEILFFNANVIGSEGADEKWLQREINYFRRLHAYPSQCKGETLFSLFWANKEYIASVCTILMDRTFVIRNSLSFPEGIMHEDEVYVFKCLLLASRAGYTDSNLYNRRVRSGSVMDLERTDRMLFSVFSCFICVKQLLPFLESVSIKKENEGAVFAKIETIITICRNRYRALDEAARFRLAETLGKDRFYFRLLILDPLALKSKIGQMQTELKTVNDKIRTTEESLREAKSQTAAANAQLATVKNDKKKLERRITDLKNSQSYRVGRVITYIPRKIREIFNSFYKNN